MADKRGPNFSVTERQLLIELANKHKHILENKQTNGVMWRDKQIAWDKITKIFNGSQTESQRTSKQLMEKYKSIKKEIKKRHSSNKNYMRGTGGGPYVPPPQPTNDEESLLAETINLSVQGLTNNSDADGRFGITGIQWEDPADNLDMLPESYGFHDFNMEKPEDQKMVEVNSTSSMPKEVEKPIEEAACSSKSWAKRRRPALTSTPKRNKTVSSAGEKFEKMAEKKLELIEIQKKAVIQKQEQDTKEHEARMELIQLKKDLLLKGQLSFEF